MGTNIDHNKDSRILSGMVHSLDSIDTGKCMDSCSIDTGMDTNKKMAMDMDNHSLVRNLGWQPMKCKAQKGREVLLLL